VSDGRRSGIYHVFDEGARDRLDARFSLRTAVFNYVINSHMKLAKFSQEPESDTLLSEAEFSSARDASLAIAMRCCEGSRV
jgi:hypothetical protein